ncbi:MAG: hypothetical protein CVV24_03435 [Ignavibacteriae bacterium HGW-Ignavibacteriae-3]|nr:MAG: hypothetical protein CVV24_03435 [Ignavibacteriae bacterium HGW-Ignavibacteriae-3]
MKKIIILIIFLMMFPALIQAQELDATVTINVEQLQTASRERLNTFAMQVQDYLNNAKFTRKPWQGDKIKCFFNIFFTASNDETSYTAQMVIASQRPIQESKLSSLIMSVMDNSWSFKYEKNQAMYFNQSDFDPLTSFLDYYAYLIIGLDADSYGPLDGTEYFQKALDIVVKGASSSSSKGWQLESASYNRRALIDNLLNAKYQVFRQDYFEYHYNGLDLFYAKGQRQTALNNMVKLIRNLEKNKDQFDSRSVLLKVFFDAKAGEFSEYLKTYPDKSIFTSLKRIDPSHTSKYDEAMKN